MPSNGEKTTKPYRVPAGETPNPRIRPPRGEIRGETPVPRIARPPKK